MQEGPLRGLCEAVRPHAGGKAKDRWPSQITILKLAHGFQTPPVSHSAKVLSYMTGRACQYSLENDFVLELLTWLKNHKGVPTKERHRVAMRSDASDRRDRMESVAAKMVNDTATDAKRDWNIETQRRIDLATAIVAGEYGDGRAASAA